MRQSPSDGHLNLLCKNLQIFCLGGVLPSSRPSEETCSGMYVSCSVTDDKCCSPLRCLDFGKLNGGRKMVQIHCPSIWIVVMKI